MKFRVFWCNQQNRLWGWNPVKINQKGGSGQKVKKSTWNWDLRLWQDIEKNTLISDRGVVGCQMPTEPLQWPYKNIFTPATCFYVLWAPIRSVPFFLNGFENFMKFHVWWCNLKNRLWGWTLSNWTKTVKIDPKRLKSEDMTMIPKVETKGGEKSAEFMYGVFKGIKWHEG